MNMLYQILEIENNLASNIQSINNTSDSTLIDAIDIEIPEVVSLISSSILSIAEDMSS